MIDAGSPIENQKKDKRKNEKERSTTKKRYDSTPILSSFLCLTTLTFIQQKKIGYRPPHSPLSLKSLPTSRTPTPPYNAPPHRPSGPRKTNHHPAAPVISPRRRALPGPPRSAAIPLLYSRDSLQTSPLPRVPSSTPTQNRRRRGEYERSEGRAISPGRVSPHPGVDERQTKCRSDGPEGTADEYRGLEEGEAG